MLLADAIAAEQLMTVTQSLSHWQFQAVQRDHSAETRTGAHHPDNPYAAALATEW